MRPCPTTFMPNAAWRAFLRRHPGWHAPITAPCRLAAAIARPAAIASAGIASAAAGYAAPTVWRWTSATIGSAWSRLVGGVPFAGAPVLHPVPVPEPSALLVLALPVGALAVIWWGR